MQKELIATLRPAYGASAEADVPVWLEPRPDGKMRVVIGDHALIADAREIRPGTWSLLVADAPDDGPADGPTNDVDRLIYQRSYVVELSPHKRGTAFRAGMAEAIVALEDARRRRLSQTMGSRATQAAKGEVIVAPIAGKIVKILIAVGDVVAAGQAVAVLEAMKMENELKAERGGTVRAIHGSPGQSVETHDKLVTLS